jgi:cytochrome c biogenesis protein ResB
MSLYGQARETTAKSMVMARDIPDLLWRAFGSRKLTLILLAVIAIAVSCGAILPQMPAGADIGSREYDHWHAGIQARYLQWTDLLAGLGLFSVLDSLGLRLPLALLLLNLSVCAVEQFEAGHRLPKCSAEAFEQAFRRASQSRTYVVVRERQSVVASLRALLEGRRYRVELDEEDQASYLSANRFFLTGWGSFVMHGGLIVALAGVVLGGRVAWREQNVALSPGQVYQIQHVRSLSVRLDDFQAELYPDGTPRAYLARLTLLQEGNEVQTGVAVPNAPFRHRGISIYQLSHGPQVTVRALDTDGQPISVQALAPSAILQEEATLQLGEQENEGYVAVPDQNLVLRIVFQSMLPSDGEDMPSLLVQAYRGGMTDLVHSEMLLDSASLQIESASYMVEWGHYAVLDIANDPGFSLTLLGATSLLAGAIAILYVPPRSIWAVVSDEGQVVEMRLARLGEIDKGGSAREFDALMEQIEKANRG